MIVLFEDTWYEKILADHGEVPDDASLIEHVLTDPDRVNFDAVHENGENFYRRGVLRYPYDVDFLKVVVRYHDHLGEPVGTVVSVYPTTHFRRVGERHKWSR